MGWQLEASKGLAFLNSPSCQRGAFYDHIYSSAQSNVIAQQEERTREASESKTNIGRSPTSRLIVPMLRLENLSFKTDVSGFWDWFLVSAIHKSAPHLNPQNRKLPNAGHFGQES